MSKTIRITKILLSITLTCLLAMTILNSSPIKASGGSVTYYHEDTVTGGNWTNAIGSPVGTYGSYARIQPNPDGLFQQVKGPASVPIGFNFSEPSTWALLLNPPYNWTQTEMGGMAWWAPNAPYTDEYVTQTPPVTYHLNGTEYIVPDGEFAGQVIQYPAFEWNWTGWDDVPTNHSEVYYNNALGTCAVGYKFAAWDDGGERCQPLNGYFNVTMHFPNGTWLLSLYGYDYEGIRQSEDYRIYDESGTILLASHQVSGPTWHNGVYETFEVVAPDPEGLNLIVQVYNDAGHYPDQLTGSTNVLLSGIYVDAQLPTGGYMVSINKLPLMAPFGLGLAVVVPAAFMLYVRQKKKKQT